MLNYTIQPARRLFILVSSFPVLQKRSIRKSAMEFIYFVNLILIFVLNILFFFSGICLNSLVIVGFWRSVLLRKKLCYFAIMILSCCDLLVVLTCHPLIALTAMLWLTEKINVYPKWLMISGQVEGTFVCSSLLALFVMSVDRYLATHHPIFHRTSMTKGKFLTVLTLLFFIQITVMTISINDMVISYQVSLLIFGTIFIPSMLFINCKLFTVARINRRNKEISPEMKKSSLFKNISGCLLVVACLLVLSIPLSVYIVLTLNSKETDIILDNAGVVGLWTMVA